MLLYASDTWDLSPHEIRGNDAPYQRQPIIDGNRKEGSVMCETAALAIWCSSIIAGMAVAMFMPHIIRETTGCRGR